MLVLNSKSDDFCFIFLILRSQRNPYVFVFRVALSTSQIRSKNKQASKQTKCYSDNNVHTLYKPRYNGHIMFFCYDCDTTSYELELKKYQFHHCETGWFPTTSLHLPLLTHLRDSPSNELCHFPNKMPSTKTNMANECLF